MGNKLHDDYFKPLFVFLYIQLSPQLLQWKVFPHINLMARLYVTKQGIKGITSSDNRWYNKFRCCSCFFKHALVAYWEELLHLVLHRWVCWSRHVCCWLPAGCHTLLTPALVLDSATAHALVRPTEK